MRKTKSFKIEGHDTQITVRELTVKEIISLMDADELADASLDTFRKIFSEKFLPLCSEKLSLDDLMEFTPSEVEEVWNHFKEVNKSFFELARKSGLLKQAEEFKEALLGDFSKLFVDLSKQDTLES